MLITRDIDQRAWVLLFFVLLFFLAATSPSQARGDASSR